MTLSTIVRLASGATAAFMSASGESATPKPAIIIVPGWKSDGALKVGGRYERIAEMLSSLGYHTLRVALRGHSGSSGDITTVSRAEHKEDMAGAWAYLYDRSDVNPSAICGLGTSYGGYTLAASGINFRLLALRAPALYPEVPMKWSDPAQWAVDDADLPAWRQQWRRTSESKALQGMADFGGKLLLVRSKNDEQMPRTVHESYVEAVRVGRGHVIGVQLEGARHELTSLEHGDFVEVLRHYFRANYPASASEKAAA